MACETIRLAEPSVLDDRFVDPLTEHLSRIVRRALRRPMDGSVLAQAIRSAAERIPTDADRPPQEAHAIRVRQVTRRLSALMTPAFRDAPGRDARRETVIA